MDDRQRGPALGAGGRRRARPRAGRVLRLVGRQGRPGRRRALRHRPGRCHRDRRRRRAARAAARLRRLQPDVARRRRAGPHPRGRRQRREHRGVHQRPWPGRRPGPHRRRLPSAAASSMFGTGISPGFVELIGIATAGICDRSTRSRSTRPPTPPSTTPPPRRSRRLRSARSTIRSCPGWRPHGTAVFGEAVAMVADALGVELDEIVCEAEYAQTTEDLDLGLLDDRRRLRGRRRRQLAGQRRRPHRRRAARAVAQGPDPRPRLADRGGPRDPDRRAAHRPREIGYPAAARLRGHDRSPTSWCSG